MSQDLTPNIDSAEVDATENLLSGFCELPTVNFQGMRSGGNKKLSLSIVNSKKNGKRVTLSDTLFCALGQPEEVAVLFKGRSLAIGAELPSATKTYKFSPSKDTHVIYNTDLILAISEAFSLDFNVRCSITFTEVTLDHFKNDKEAEVPFAIINMTP